MSYEAGPIGKAPLVCCKLEGRVGAKQGTYPTQFIAGVFEAAPTKELAWVDDAVSIVVPVVQRDSVVWQRR